MTLNEKEFKARGPFEGRFWEWQRGAVVKKLTSRQSKRFRDYKADTITMYIEDVEKRSMCNSSSRLLSVKCRIGG